MITLPVEIVELIISHTGNVNLYVNLFGKVLPSTLDRLEKAKLSNALRSIRYCRDIFSGENDVKFCAKLYSKLFKLEKWEKCFHIYLLCFYHFSEAEKTEFVKLTNSLVSKLGYDLAMHTRFYVENNPSLYLYFLEKSDLMKFIMYMNLSRYNGGLSFLLFTSNTWIFDGKNTIPTYITFDHVMEHFYNNVHIEKVNHKYYTLINDFLR